MRCCVGRFFVFTQTVPWISPRYRLFNLKFKPNGYAKTMKSIWTGAISFGLIAIIDRLSAWKSF